MLQPGREVHAVGPEIDVASGGEIAPLPAFVLVLPARRQPPHGRRREARRLGPEQRRQRLGELARRYTLQVKPGQELLNVLGPAQVGRQDRRGEPDRPAVSDTAAVAQLRSANLERADPGLEPALGRMSVAHQAAPTVLVHEHSMGGEERLDLGLDRLRQHPPGALAQHGQQRIVHDARSWPRQGNDGILLHGVSSW